jgi:hypothetical protein
MQTESNMTSVHSKGTLSDNTGSISFVGNCAPKAAFDIQLTGKNKAGKLITVEYLTVKSGFWSRSHGAKKAWGKWKKGPGYNADIFIQFVSILCPQLDAQELAKATLSQVDTLVNDLGDEQVAATPVRHLQLASSGSSLDIYFAQSTYYWVLLKTFDQSSQLQTSVTYSRFNQVKLKAPG